MKYIKRITALLLCLALTAGLTACAPATQSDIIIIYTSDIHGILDENIGYDGLAAYRKQALEKSPYVTMVDAGDATQGTAITTISQGEATTELLKAVNYDILTIGNHEFDYGLERLSEILTENGDRFINSNVFYTGKNEDNPINKLDKYRIVKYGKTKVAYIALLTPYSLWSAAPYRFKEDGEVAVDFFGGREDQDFCALVQELVDECKAAGADYVVALCHLGSEEAVEPYSSTTLAASTKGIDVIIDAHSHRQFACKSLTNAENKEVLITSCGTQLQSIGQVTISPSGLISASNITDYAAKDEETTKKIAEIKEEYTATLNEPLFVNRTPLSIYDGAGIRVIRNKEMPLGDLIADAFRHASGADIGLINGGGIRADLPTGNVSYADLMNISPYGNQICAIELTGQELLDYLEYVYRYTQIDYADGGINIREYGSFMQVSGLKLTIDTSVTSDVTVDQEDNLISVGEKRRLKDVMVETADGSYEPIDPQRTYVVGGSNYYLLNGGSGTEVFFAGKNAVLQDGVADYDALYTYIKDVLAYDLSRYETVAGRITLE